MIIALFRMKLRLFLYTTRRGVKNIFLKTAQKTTEITDNQKENTAKLAKMEVDEI